MDRAEVRGEDPALRLDAGAFLKPRLRGVLWRLVTPVLASLLGKSVCDAAVRSSRPRAGRFQPRALDWNLQPVPRRLAASCWRSTMKITDTQTATLTAAAARPDGTILPLPAHIRGGAIGKVCDALVAKGLAINVGLPSKQTLVIGDEGRLALGLAIRLTASAETKPRQSRAGTKQAQLVAMLEAPEGASTEEIVAVFGWQRHTVRAERSPERSRKGSACRSGPRRSRVADASTASCRDRANSGELPRNEEPVACSFRPGAPLTVAGCRRGTCSVR